MRPLLGLLLAAPLSGVPARADGELTLEPAGDAAAGRVVEVLRRRLERDEVPGASVEAAGPRRVVVRATVVDDRLKRLLLTPGAIEFRIVVDPEDEACARLRELCESRPGGIDAGALLPHAMSEADAKRFPFGVRWTRLGLHFPGRENEKPLAFGSTGCALCELDGENVTGRDLYGARWGEVPTAWTATAKFVDFKVQRDRREAWKRLTARRDRWLAFILDGRILYAEHLSGRRLAEGRTQGGRSLADARFLAALIDSGELPCALRVVGERRFSPL